MRAYVAAERRHCGWFVGVGVGVSVVAVAAVAVSVAVAAAVAGAGAARGAAGRRAKAGTMGRRNLNHPHSPNDLGNHDKVEYALDWPVRC